VVRMSCAYLGRLSIGATIERHQHWSGNPALISPPRGHSGGSLCLGFHISEPKPPLVYCPFLTWYGSSIESHWPGSGVGVSQPTGRFSDTEVLCSELTSTTLCH
jgi:hypothetical protein